jgi:hypothetical protein
MDVPGSDCLKNTEKSALVRRRYIGKTDKNSDISLPFQRGAQ